jgi:hypothetical protein
VTVRRRALLTGAAGVAGLAALGGLTDEGVLPGKGHLDRALGIASGQSVDAALPAASGERVVAGAFRSTRMGPSLPRSPTRSDCRPTRRCRSRSPCRAGAAPRWGTFTTSATTASSGAQVRAAGAPFAIAAVDGGSSY